jgi:hypothetical protein
MSRNDPSEQREHTRSKFPSLNLIFDLTKERIENQRERVNALDSKANFTLISATTLISAALVIQTAGPSKASPGFIFPSYCFINNNRLLNALPLLLLLFFYLCVLFTAYLAYKNRIYKYVPEPDELLNTYLVKEEEITKAEVFEAMRFAYNHNERTIKNKASRLELAFILLGCEAITLVLFMFFRINC